jgi:hypothetical protein
MPGCNGEATSVDRDAVANAHRFGSRRRCNYKPVPAAISPELDDRADFFNEAGEHLSRIAMQAGEASTADD